MHTDSLLSLGLLQLLHSLIISVRFGCGFKFSSPQLFSDALPEGFCSWIFSVFAELFVLILKLLRFGQPISQRFQIITNPFRKTRNRKTDDFGVFDEFLALKSDLEDQGSRNLFV